jgi:hypothetical protein
VIRDAINAGDIPGPRYLANAQEIARRDGELVAGITAFADGPEEMRQVIREHVTEVGADNIKLSMSGEEVRIDQVIGLYRDMLTWTDHGDQIRAGLLLYRRRDSSLCR